MRRENRFLADEFVDRIDLSLTALIAPDQCGANDLIRRVEQNQSVHLTGEPDATNILARSAGRRKNSTNRKLCRVPPVLRTLFGPERTFHPHVFVRGGERVTHLPALVHEQRARAAGSDVNSKPVHS